MYFKRENFKVSGDDSGLWFYPKWFQLKNLRELNRLRRKFDTDVSRKSNHKYLFYRCNVGGSGPSDPSGPLDLIFPKDLEENIRTKMTSDGKPVFTALIINLNTGRVRLAFGADKLVSDALNFNIDSVIGYIDEDSRAKFLAEYSAEENARLQALDEESSESSDDDVVVHIRTRTVLTMPVAPAVIPTTVAGANAAFQGANAAFQGANAAFQGANAAFQVSSLGYCYPWTHYSWPYQPWPYQTSHQTMYGTVFYHPWTYRPMFGTWFH